MYISPGVYFSRIDFGYFVYDGRCLYPVGFTGIKSEVFTVTCFEREFEINFLENKVKRLEEGRPVEEKNITEFLDSGVSFEPFKL